MNASRLMILDVAESMGWTQSTQIDLLTLFIDQLGDGGFLMEFAEFIKEQAEKERELTDDKGTGAQ